MRLLHVADWHLGRTTWNASRSEDHDAAIAEILSIARDWKPHLILHAGDLFDGFRPSTVEMQRGIEALQDLAAVAPVVVLAGNHDSPGLFRVFNQIRGDGGRIRFVPWALPPAEGGILEYPGDRDEVIRLAPLPFVHHNRTISAFEDPATWMASYADQVGQIHDALARGLEKGYDPARHVLLFAAHLHVTGARFSQSERQIHVTDTFATRVERLPAVSYAAYGHIHRPQPLPGTVTGRYAGSPIPLDFGEEGEAKSIVLVEASPGRPAVVRTEALSGGRPLLKLEGTLDDIAAKAPGVGLSLCTVVVKTEKTVPDLQDRVRALLPEAVLLSVVEDCAATKLTVLSRADVDTGVEPSFSDLFRDYLAAQGTKAASVDRVMSLFETLIHAAGQETPVELPEIEALRASGAETEKART